MARAKPLVTAAAVLAAGVCIGWVSAGAGAAGAPPIVDPAALFLLEPATADRPAVREADPEDVPEPAVLETQG